MISIQRWAQFAAMVVATMLAAACGRTDGTGDSATLEVSSTAVAHGDDVPVRFTCDGDDVAPDLTWADAPADTVEIVIIVDDPDAPGGTFTHWTVWGLQPDAAPIDGDLPQGAVEGTNDFGEIVNQPRGRAASHAHAGAASRPSITSVASTVRDLYLVYAGRCTLHGALRDARVRLSGARTMVSGFHRWMGLSTFAAASRAGVARREGAPADGPQGGRAERPSTIP